MSHKIATSLVWQMNDSKIVLYKLLKNYYTN